MPPRSPAPVLLTLLALLLIASGAIASVAIGPEVPLRDPATEAVHSTPLVASNGSAYLVAWSGGASVFALPVSAAGQPLLERGVPVDSPTAFKRLSDIATDRSGYLIATLSTSGINVVAVDASVPPRVVSQRLLVPLTSTDVLSARAKLAWNGSNYLLVFTRSDASPISGLLLDRTGAPAGSEFEIEPKRRQPSFSVASNGDGFGIAGTSFDACDPANSCTGQLFTDSVSAAGSVTSRYVIGPTVNAFLPSDAIGRSLVYTGAMYVLAWSDTLGTFRSVNELALDSNMRPARGAVVIASGTIGAGTMSIGVARRGSGAVVFVPNGSTIQAVRIGVNGEVLDVPPVPIIQIPPPQQMAPQIDAASAGNEVFAVWPKWIPTGGTDEIPILTGARIDFANPSQTGASLAVGSPEQQVSDIAAAGRVQVVVYVNRPALERPIVKAAMLIDGVSAATPVQLSSTGNQPYTPKVATNGHDFVATWTELPVQNANGQTIVKIAAIRRDGTLGSVEDVATGVFDSPQIAWTGQYYLLSWTETPMTASGPDQRLWAVRVSSDGNVLDPAPRQIEAAPGFRTARLQVIPTRNGYVGVFLHGEPYNYHVVFAGFVYDIYAAHVSPAGDFLDTPVQITNTPESEQNVAVAADPGTGNLMLTWLASPLSPYDNSKQFAAVLSPSLAISRLIDLSTLGSLDVGWSGTSFLVTSTGAQVQLSRYSNSGDPLPIAGSVGPVELTQTSMSGPAVIAGTGGGAVVAYTRAMPEITGGDAARVVARPIWDYVRRRSAVAR